MTDETGHERDRLASVDAQQTQDEIRLPETVLMKNARDVARERWELEVVEDLKAKAR